MRRNPMDGPDPIEQRIDPFLIPPFSIPAVPAESDPQILVEAQA